MPHAISPRFFVASLVAGVIVVGSFASVLTAEATFTHTPPPPTPKECKMTIEKEVDKDTAGVGDILTYTITFKNIGTGDCTGGGVKVIDFIDSQLSFESESHSGNVDAGYEGAPLYNASSHSLIWNAHELNPGESGWVKWKGKIRAPSQCGDFTIKNSAKISARELDNFGTWIHSNWVVTTGHKDCPPPPPPGSPVCTLTANPTSFTNAGNATLTWTSQNTVSGSINQGIGTITPVSGGSTSTRVTAATTYIATFIGTNNETITCRAEVTLTPPPPPPPSCTVGCGGGGTNQPVVVMFSKAVDQPLAALYLSQIPYTGFGGGPVVMVIFWALLIIWSAFIAYLLIVKGFGRRLLELSGLFDGKKEEQNPSPAATPFAATEPRSAPILPKMSYTPVSFNNHAKAGKPVREHAVPPTGYGPLVFEETGGVPRIRLSSVSEVREPHVEPDTVRVATASPAPISVFTRTTAKAMQQNFATTNPSNFLGALLGGDEKGAFVSARGDAGIKAVREAINVLDATYRARIENRPTPLPQLSGWSNEQLETLIGTLTLAIDRAYTSDDIATKLAISRALDTIRVFQGR